MDAKKNVRMREKIRVSKGAVSSDAASAERMGPVGMVWRARRHLRSAPGQGTTEYAILVGVLVVIAILSITLFRPKLEELWNAIASGINGL